nr:MAG TPA: Single strand binding protein [Caudoviricetes sp.]
MTNSVIAQGRVVATPELRQTPSGVSVCAFSIAHNRNYKPKGADEPQTDFFDCKAMGSVAEFAARYLSKGKLVNVSGKLETRLWEAKDGTKRKTTEIIVKEIDFCEKKSDGDGYAARGDRTRETDSRPQYQENTKPDVNFEEVNDDLDLPF